MVNNESTNLKVLLTQKKTNLKYVIFFLNFLFLLFSKFKMSQLPLRAGKETNFYIF